MVISSGPAPKVSAPKGGGSRSFGLPRASSTVALNTAKATGHIAGAPPSPTAGLTRGQTRLLVRDRAFTPWDEAPPTRGPIGASGQRADEFGRMTAAIRNGLAPGSGVDTIFSTLTKQIIGLPESTLQGIESLGGASAQALTGNFRPLGHLLSSAVTQDPFVQAISQGSLKPLEHNPLGTGLDLLAGYGIVGKGLGAAARASQVGGEMGGRAALEAAPGIGDTAVARGFSPNLATKAIQGVYDQMRSSLLPDAVKAKRGEQLIRQQVAMLHTGHVAQRAADEAHVVKALQAAKPTGAEERAVAPLLVGTGGGRGVLENIYSQMQRELPRDPQTLATRNAAMTAIQKALAKDDAGKFDWGAASAAAHAYKPMQDYIESAKQVLGIQDAEQMARRADMERALLEPNVHRLDKRTTNPVLQQAVRDLKATRREAQVELKRAQGAHDAYLGAGGARGAHDAASNALAQLSRAVPVDPATDALMNRMLEMRQMLDETHPGLKTFHEAEVALRKAHLQNVTEELVAARKALTKDKLQGTMIEDATQPPLTSGPLKGMRVRPITAEDIAAIRAKDVNGPGFGQFVTRVNPERERVPSVAEALHSRREPLGRAAETGRAKYTGESLISGDYRTGWSALARSQLRDVHLIHALQEDNHFFDRFSLPTEDGMLTHPTAADAKNAAQQYQDRTGIKMSVVEDRHGGIHVVPTAAKDELLGQRKMDYPSSLGKLLTKPNAVFRKTVLPYSPKLPIMHTVENVSRTLLLERGNPLRAALDYRRMKNFLDALPPGERAHWEALVTPGSLSRTGAAGELEDLGKLPVDRGAVSGTVHAAITSLDTLSTQIIKGQRWLEKRAQTVAGGAYLRQQLREMGHGFLDAEKGVKTYAQKLADGLATEADAERAARMMHKAYGQYNAFTARSRMVMRVMPFLPWYMNAARLVMQVLPLEHPLASALIQDVHQATMQAWNAQHQGLPPDMQTSVNVGPNAWLDVGKLTPVGLPNQNPATTAAQLLTPWLASPTLALLGEDPFGAQFKGPDTPYGHSAYNSIVSGKPPIAGLQALEQVLQEFGGPINDIARAVEGNGGTFFNTSTPDLRFLTGGLLGKVAMKPGTTVNGPLSAFLPPAVDKVLDPLHPTHYVAGGSSTLPAALGKPEGHFNQAKSGGSLGKPEGHL